MNIKDSINTIKNIGEKREKLLNRLGIFTIYDLLTYYPRDYDDRSNVLNISDITEEGIYTFYAQISGTVSNLKRGFKTLTKVPLKDSTGEITALFYNQPYLKSTFLPFELYIFTGKVVFSGKKKEIQNPEYEKVTEKDIVSGGRIVPVYSLTNGVNQKFLRTLILNVLSHTENEIKEFIPKEIKENYFLCDRSFAISNIHYPKSNDDFFIARRRLVFEELLIFQTCLLGIKENIDTNLKGFVIKDFSCVKDFLKQIPFDPTNAQKRVIKEIKKDISSGKVMNRLVQGDVGSGKTFVAMLLAFVAINNGYQVSLMAPTEVLAKQHFDSFSNVFEKFGIKTALLTGSQKKKEKDEIYENIKSGFVKMVIGTHAVIQEGVKFSNLGLVITDEQHRFGVRQRLKLSEKGENPHILVMTATPIPRTLALILYGDLDISIIDELPPGRQKIDTLCVDSSYHERIYTFIKKEIDKGRQIYIVCPMVSESDKLELKSVTEYGETLKNDVFNNYNVEFVYGKMKPKEKQEVMERFSKGETHILISTTVIEVGINVPNATVMLIENAERFGLAQLHQLRGRIGRGSEKSYCILICDSKNKVAKQRMEVMKKSDDGFYISEKDLMLRGPGDFFGTKQHGLPELKIANLYKDTDILKETREAALDILNMKDTKTINAKFFDEILKYFDGNVGL